MDFKSMSQLKLEFNNEVISIKPSIVQAKIQTINKLTKKIKMLKSRKGSEERVEKHKRKANSFVAEIMIIKRIRRNDLAKFAMSNFERLPEAIDNPTPSEERAMARLVSHKALKGRFEDLKKKYASVPLARLFEQDPKKVRRKKRKETLKKRAAQGKNGTTSTAGFSVETSELQTSDSESESTVEPETAKKKKRVVKLIEDEGFSSERTEEDEEVKTKELQNSVEKCKSAEKTLQKRFLVRLESATEENSDSFVSDEKPKPKNKLAPNKEIQSKMVIDMDKLPDSSRPETTVDSFFVTNGGSDYLTVALPRPADRIKDENRNRKMRRATMFGNRLPPPKRKPYIAKNSTTHEIRNRDSNKKINADKSQRFSDKAQSNSEEKLHPSWQAKKQQSTILPFEGNKIMFD